MNLCPSCLRRELAPTDQVEHLPSILDKWEDLLKASFPEDVRREYGGPSSGDTRLWQCMSCGFGRFEPALAGSTRFYETIETSNYYNESKWEFDRSIRRILSFGGRKVVDVGCGSGHFLRQLRDKAPNLELSGAELNEGLLKALEMEGFGAISSDLGQVGSIEERFDTVCMFQILEHVADPIAFLEAFSRLVAPMGEMIISTPDAGGPIRNFSQSLTEVPPHHVSRWTEQAYRMLLPRLGFSVVSVEREPLPHYLWDSYLPVLWDDDIWPATLLDPMARQDGHVSVADRAKFGAARLKEANVTHLYEVPGHTILVIARRSR